MAAYWCNLTQGRSPPLHIFNFLTDCSLLELWALFMFSLSTFKISEEWKRIRSHDPSYPSQMVQSDPDPSINITVYKIVYFDVDTLYLCFFIFTEYSVSPVVLVSCVFYFHMYNKATFEKKKSVTGCAVQMPCVSVPAGSINSSKTKQRGVLKYIYRDRGNRVECKICLVRCDNISYLNPMKHSGQQNADRIRAMERKLPG